MMCRPMPRQTRLPAVTLAPRVPRYRVKLLPEVSQRSARKTVPIVLPRALPLKSPQAASAESQPLNRHRSCLHQWRELLAELWLQATAPHRPLLSKVQLQLWRREAATSRLSRPAWHSVDRLQGPQGLVVRQTSIGHFQEPKAQLKLPRLPLDVQKQRKKRNLAMRFPPVHLRR